ncbi:unnamed protein product [Chilo suppressalis]|uniref:RING-type domain-containing protein n=1 Tax=Chilo suppressalis TaxID=168631 RepID=A0ABN8EE21_CHISP|nr:unnamed protein product [Chilo suppressalis]
MLNRGRCSKMPCESCAVQFSVFKRKQVCYECERYYCSGCLRREGTSVLCTACKVLSTRPLLRNSIAHLKVRDLQCFLQRQNVSTRGCVEKEELVSLCVSHVNSAAFRRRGPRARPSPFSTLKGFTNNLNVFINNAFEIRNNAQPAPAPPQHSNCYNASHAHAPRPSAPQPQSQRPAPDPPRERFTTTPGGERDIVVPVPAPGSLTRTPSADGSGARVESADCFEIEDLDDSGWEFVARPADPLPDDSDVLIAENQAPTATPPPAPVPPSAPSSPPRAGGLTPLGGVGGVGSQHRATSELELRPREAPPEADSLSLHDEPDNGPDADEPVTLDRLQSASQLELLSVRQLKQLLARNRVAYRGCLERSDLLHRARTLYADHAHYRAEVDNLPLEECCKICMAAPLECVLLECGHIAACTACSRQLAECPICRQYVVRAVRCFRS